jgi:hypothetical protein
MSVLIVFALVLFGALVNVTLPRVLPLSNAAAFATSIDTVTDADLSAGGSHVLTFDNGDSETDFVLSGDNANNGAPTTSSSASQWWISNMSGNAGTIGANLLPSGSGNHNGAVAFKQQVDMTKPWSLNFDMNIQKLNANGVTSGNGAGDFLGFVLTPVSPSRAGTGQNAGGLGIAGLANTYAWGIDFYDNTNGSAFTSPSYDNANLIANPGSIGYASPTQILGFRHTDASGNLTNPNTVATPNSSTEVSQECSFNQINGTDYSSTAATSNWNSNNTPQYIANVDVSYAYSGSGQGALTAVLNASSNCDTAHKQPSAAAHTGQTFNYTVPLTTNSMSVAMAASDGGMYSRMGVTINSFTTELGTGTTNVTYLDQAGNALRAPTSFIANTGEAIGITPANVQAGSPNNATDDIAFLAPTFPGYYLSSAPDVTIVSDLVSGSSTTSGNAMPLQYQGEYQAANISIDYPAGDPNAGTPITLAKSGVTGQAFSFNVAASVPAGYHLQDATQSTISGTYDATENCNNSPSPQATTPSGCAAVTNDLAPQNFTAELVADVQTLNVNYTFPPNHDLSSALASGQISQNSTTAGTFSTISIPQIGGYTSYYTTPSLNSGATTAGATIPAIAADSTSNGTAAQDSTPQTVTVSYVADPRSINITYASPCSSSCTQAITQSASGTAYATDSSYDAVPITQISGYTSQVSVNGGTPQCMQTYPAGTFGPSDITLSVTYTAWTATVKFYTVQQDSSATNIGAVTLLPGANSTASGDAGTNFAVLFGTDAATQTTNLQSAGGVPTGYHVTGSYWSNDPTGADVSQSPPYTDDWTWADMTNIGTGVEVNYQAAIVYTYTADSQTANATIIGAPAGNSEGVVNGSTAYTGVSAGVQVVNITPIAGYSVAVTDGSGNAVNVLNNALTITYDSTSNGTSTTDATPQNFTITYTPITAEVVINYTYQTDTGTNIVASGSTDTTAYTAPNLPASAQITTQTGSSYSLSVPNIPGYAWTLTDGTTSWDASSLPASFTSDGTTKTYTVVYAPVSGQVTINYYEATYNASGAFTFTQNAVPGMAPTVLTGAVGSTVGFSVTTNSISVPSGWQLDPMGAALAQVNDSVGASDADGLKGGSSAKVLTVQASPTSYIVYLARDIQSVQVHFSGTPNPPATIYQDGRSGASYSVSTSGFAIAGYTYTISAPDGSNVTQISGTYDTTANANASIPISNNGDGDSSPQVYTVTYSADFQQALVQADVSRPGGATTLETVNGTTGAAINFTTTDASLAISGYTYCVQGPNALNYATLQAANTANKTFDATDNTSGSDSSPQVFTVHYTPSVQQAVLQTGASDPNGAHVVETANGTTSGAISFTHTDSTLALPGYTYQVEAGGSSYATLSAAVAANSTYDNTDNGTSTSDSSAQVFSVVYTPNSQSVTVQYQYADGTGAATSVTQTKVTNASGDAVASPAISGYTPSSASVTPSFAVNSSGALVTPVVTVTYTADTQNATISYENAAGSDISQYIGSAPTSATGKTDQTILSAAPNLPGYTFTGFYLNGSSTLSAPGDLSSAVYQAGSNTLELRYTANSQTINVRYVYSDTDGSPTQGDGLIPSAAIGGTPNPNPYTSSTNAANITTTVPSLTGYTSSTTLPTLSWNVDASGNLVTPTVTVTYSANQNDDATIAYKDTADNNLITRIPNMPTVSSQGITGTQITSDGAVSVSGYTLDSVDYNSTTLCSTSTTPCGSPPDLSTAVYTGNAGGDTLTFIYSPNPQSVVVHYQYASGGRAGQDFCTDTISAVTNASTPSLVTAGTISGTADPAGCGATPTGYTLSGASTQNVSWAVDQSGNLVTPEEFFYYNANKTEAVVNYGTSSNPTALNSLLPSSTLSGTQNGSTGDVITTSGAVSIPGYTFSALEFNSTEVASTVQDANGQTLTYTASDTPSYQDSVQYIYTPNPGVTTYHFVDVYGNSIYPDQTSNAFSTGDAITDYSGYATIASGYTYATTSSSGIMPASGVAQVTYNYTGDFQQLQVSFQDMQGATIASTQTINGTSGAVVNYNTNASDQAINYDIPGYTISTDGRSSTSRFDTTANASSSDASVQNVVMTYSADSQTIMVYGVVGETNGRQLFSTTLSGVTAAAADYSTVEKSIAGYTLTVDGTTDPANTTFNADESTDQNVYLIFTPDVQDAVLETDSSDPAGAQRVCLVEKYSQGVINFNDATTPCSDADLKRPGYSYKVTGPDDAQYDNLTQAIAANHFYDTTDNAVTPLPPPYNVHSSSSQTLSQALSQALLPAPSLGLQPPPASMRSPQYTPLQYMPLSSVATSDDAAAQEFLVHYTANTQSAFVQTINDPSGNITYAVVTGLTGAAISSLGVTDADLARTGFTYYVQGPDGVQYATLGQALVANSNFDANDGINQVFSVVYDTPPIATPNLRPPNLPPPAGSIVPSDPNNPIAGYGSCSVAAFDMQDCLNRGGEWTSVDDASGNLVSTGLDLTRLVAPYGVVLLFAIMTHLGCVRTRRKSVI